MHSKHRQTTYAALATAAILALAGTAAFAKGGGVGYRLEGTVTSVRLAGDRVDLLIVGHLVLDQYSGGPTTRQVIRYECARGINASLGQWTSFFAMSSDWRGGAIRGQGELGRLAKAALERGSVFKIELQNPQIDFTDWQCPVVKADAIRATDHDLK